MKRKENSTYPESRTPYRGPKNHVPRVTSAPLEQATPLDLAWFAGIFEGEGGICKAAGSSLKNRGRQGWMNEQA